MLLDRPDLPKVRVAVPDDEEDVLQMCRELHAENGIFALNEDKVRNILHRCYNRQFAIVGVIGPIGAVEASTAIIFSDMYYTNDHHLAELWNFVRPTFRRSRNADALIECGKRAADQIGIPFITGIITNKRTAEKVRLYRRRLGYPAGAFFAYGAKWETASEPTVEDFWSPFESRVEKRHRLKRSNGTAALMA